MLAARSLRRCRKRMLVVIIILSDRDYQKKLQCYDKTSIESTYASNRTLRSLLYLFRSEGDENILYDIASSLEMNKNEDKAEVSRQKILKQHSGKEEVKRKCMCLLVYRRVYCHLLLDGSKETNLVTH